MGDHDQRTGPATTKKVVNAGVMLQRRAVEQLAELVNDALETNQPVPWSAFESFAHYFRKPDAASSAKPIAEWLTGAAELVTARATGREQPVPTPFDGLNEALAGGFWPGVHFPVGATGVGKTVLTSQIAFNAAKAGHVVAIAPLEMGARETTVRLAAEAAGVSWSGLMTGQAGRDELDRFHGALDELEALPLIVDDLNPQGWTASDLEALCRKAVALAEERNEHGRTPLVIVDFVQIMGADEGDRGDLRERIRAAAYAARAHAVKHGCAVLMVSSVSRAAYKITSGNPRTLEQEGVRFHVDELLEDVGAFELQGAGSLVGLGKESGELEYSATSVSVMVRAPGGEGIALAVAKQRYAPPSWVPLVFDRARYRSASLEEAHAIADAFRVPAQGEEVEEADPRIAEAITEVIGDAPGIGSAALEERTRALLQSRKVPAGTRKVRTARGELLNEGAIVNAKDGNRNRYYLASEQPSEPLALPFEKTGSRPVPEDLPACPAGQAGTREPHLPDCPVGPFRGPGPRQAGSEPVREPLEGTTREPLDRKAQIVAFVGQHPECSTRAIRQEIKGKAKDVGDAIAELLASGELFDVGNGRGRRLVPGTGSQVVPATGSHSEGTTRGTTRGNHPGNRSGTTEGTIHDQGGAAAEENR